MEYGRNLEPLRTRNPGALAVELKRMGRQTRQGKLAEFEAIAPIVRSIASDVEISAISRHYAQAMLAKTRS